MHFHELTFDVKISKDIQLDYAYDAISRFIAKGMLSDVDLKQLHTATGYKNYVLSLFQPIEKEKVYLKGKIYSVKMRSFDAKLILKMKKVLYGLEDENFIGLSSVMALSQYRFISKLKCITPVHSTMENRSWVPEDGLPILMDRIHSNAVKKYRSIFGYLEEPAQNFIETIELGNRKPIKIRYKNNSLLCSKPIITVHSDEVSQKLAYTLLGAGMLEKNSIALGFISAEGAR